MEGSGYEGLRESSKGFWPETVEVPEVSVVPSSTLQHLVGGQIPSFFIRVVKNIAFDSEAGGAISSANATSAFCESSGD